MAGKYKGSGKHVPKERKEKQKGRGGSMSSKPRVHRGGRKKK